MVSSTVIIHKLPPSLRYTRLKRIEKRIVTIFPSSQKHKASQKNTLSLHPTFRAPHALAHARILAVYSTQAAQRDGPGDHCGSHHPRGSSLGGEQTQPLKATGSNQQQAPLLGGSNVFRTVAPLLPKPLHVPASCGHMLHHFQGLLRTADRL